MREWQSLSHVKWECKYHVVIVPKYRKKVLYGRLRGEVGKIIRQLCRQKEVELIEGHAMPDHIHLVLSVPPKYSIAMVLGYLKGKSAIHIHRTIHGIKQGFTGRHFWSRGYTWTQSMCGSQTASAQGICPAGWHVPTDPEYVALTNYLGSTNCGAYREGNSNYCGAPAGDRMKAAGLCQGRTPCGDSGFNGLLGGADSSGLGDYTIFWTSSKNSNNIEAWRSALSLNQGGVDSTYFYSPFSSGRAIRCLKD